MPSIFFFILYRMTFNLVKTDGWCCSFSFLGEFKHLGVGVGSLLLSEGGHNVDKAPVVLDATLGAASLLLLFLLLLNLENRTWKQSLRSWCI